MAFVMATTGLIVRVDEPYDDLIALMDGPDLFEAHVDGAAATFRAAGVIAVSVTHAALMPLAPEDL